MRVQATSKTFSICRVGLSGLERERERERDAYEADAVDFHGLFRELACDLDKIFGNLNRESEGH